MDGHCTYCESDLAAYEPIVVGRQPDGEGPPDDERPPGGEWRPGDERPPSDTSVHLGAFCNHACLSAHIDEAGLADDDACRWEPEA